MADSNIGYHGGVPAGSVSTFVRKTKKVLLHQQTAVVPCGDCTACCECGYDVDLRPGEGEGLEYVERGGIRYLKHDDADRCFYLKDGKCSIYESRPAACREYDCRLMFYCGVMPKDNPKIKEAIRRWKPVLNTHQDRELLMAIRMASFEALQEGMGAENACANGLLKSEEYMESAHELALKLRSVPADKLNDFVQDKIT